METLITLWSFGVKMNYSDIYFVRFLCRKLRSYEAQIAKCVNVLFSVSTI